jgi:hypothetical protein
MAGMRDVEACGLAAELMLARSSAATGLPFAYVVAGIDSAGQPDEQEPAVRSFSKAIERMPAAGPGQFCGRQCRRSSEIPSRRTSS